MKKYLLLLLLPACAPVPLCDREAVLWDKVGTTEDTCAARKWPAAPIVCLCDGDKRDGPIDPPLPPKPPHNPPTTPEKPGSDRGNPGNDKPVGRAGEKADFNMAERFPIGNRGKSN